MTELSVILGLNLASIVLVLALARWLLHDAPLAAEARNVLAAMRGAVATFRTRQTRLVLMALVLSMAALASSAATFAADAGIIAQLVLGLGLGGGFALGAGRLASALGARAGRTTASALAGTSAAPLLSSLRGAAALSLGVELGVSLLTVSALLWTRAASSDELASWLPHARLLLSGCALGAVATSAIVQSSGAAVSAAAEAGLHQVEPGTTSRFRLEAQNPLMVTSAVGPELGRLSTHVHHFIALSLLCNVVALAGVPAEPGPLPFTLLAACLLIRALGLMASAIALLSVRVDDGDDPVVVLFRGQLAAGAMGALCIVGACRWLLGEGSWTYAAGIGALGLLGQVLVASAARLWLQRRAAPLRAIRDAALGGSAVAGGYGAGLGGLLAAVVLVGPLVVLALALLLALGGEFENPFAAFALCLAGFVATLPFSLALSTTDPVIESGCGLASLGPGGGAPQALSRLSALDFVAAAARAMGDLHTTAVWVVVAAGLSLSSLGRLSGNLAVAASGTVLGVGFVLSVIGLSVLHAARTVRSSNLEAQRQLRSATGHDAAGRVAVPATFSPSYREALHGSLDVALAGITLPASALLALPTAVFALASRWLGAEQLHTAVGWFLAGALGVALSLGAVALAASVLLSGARRHSRAGNPALQLALNDADQVAHATGMQLAFASRLALAGATATGFVLIAVVS